MSVNFPAERLIRKVGSVLIASRGTVAFAIFISGAAGQYLTDVILAVWGSAEELVLWTQLKPLVLIGGAISLLGLEQVIVREPNSTYPVVRLAAVVSLAVSLIIGLVSYQFFSIRIGLAALAGVFMFSISTIIFSISRSAGALVYAHLGRDAWKIVLLALCAVSVALNGSLDMSILLPAAFIVGTLPFVNLLRYRPAAASQHSRDVYSTMSALRLGMPFCLSAISLALGSYGELLIINSLASELIVREYFVNVLVFAYPALIFNTFIAGIISVKIRDDPAVFLKVANISPIFNLIAVVALLSVFFAIGAVVALILGIMTPILAAVGALLALSGAVRLVAVLSTSGLGVLAPRAMLDKLAILYFVGSLVMVGAIAVLIMVGIYPGIAAAACVAAYWTARLLVAQNYSRRVADGWNGRAA